MNKIFFKNGRIRLMGLYCLMWIEQQSTPMVVEAKGKLNKSSYGKTKGISSEILLQLIGVSVCVGGVVKKNNDDKEIKRRINKEIQKEVLKIKEKKEKQKRIEEQKEKEEIHLENKKKDSLKKESQITKKILIVESNQWQHCIDIKEIIKKNIIMLKKDMTEFNEYIKTYDDIFNEIITNMQLTLENNDIYINQKQFLEECKKWNEYQYFQDLKKITIKYINDLKKLLENTNTNPEKMKKIDDKYIDERNNIKSREMQQWQKKEKTSLEYDLENIRLNYQNEFVKEIPTLMSIVTCFPHLNENFLLNHEGINNWITALKKKLNNLEEESEKLKEKIHENMKYFRIKLVELSELFKQYKKEKEILNNTININSINDSEINSKINAENYIKWPIIALLMIIEKTEELHSKTTNQNCSYSNLLKERNEEYKKIFTEMQAEEKEAEEKVKKNQKSKNIENIELKKLQNRIDSLCKEEKISQTLETKIKLFNTLINYGKNFLLLKIPAMQNLVDDLEREVPKLEELNKQELIKKIKESREKLESDTRKICEEYEILYAKYDEYMGALSEKMNIEINYKENIKINYTDSEEEGMSEEEGIYIHTLKEYPNILIKEKYMELNTDIILQYTELLIKSKNNTITHDEFTTIENKENEIQKHKIILLDELKESQENWESAKEQQNEGIKELITDIKKLLLNTEYKAENNNKKSLEEKKKLLEYLTSETPEVSNVLVLLIPEIEKFCDVVVAEFMEELNKNDEEEEVITTSKQEKIDFTIDTNPTINNTTELEVNDTIINNTIELDSIQQILHKIIEKPIYDEIIDDEEHNKKMEMYKQDLIAAEKQLEERENNRKKLEQEIAKFTLMIKNKYTDKIIEYRKKYDNIKNTIENNKPNFRKNTIMINFSNDLSIKYPELKYYEDLIIMYTKQEKKLQILHLENMNNHHIIITSQKQEDNQKFKEIEQQTQIQQTKLEEEFKTEKEKSRIKKEEENKEFTQLLNRINNLIFLFDKDTTILKKLQAKKSLLTTYLNTKEYILWETLNLDVEFEKMIKKLLNWENLIKKEEEIKNHIIENKSEKSSEIKQPTITLEQKIKEKIKEYNEKYDNYINVFNEIFEEIAIKSGQLEKYLKTELTIEINDYDIEPYSLQTLESEYYYKLKQLFDQDIQEELENLLKNIGNEVGNEEINKKFEQIYQNKNKEEAELEKEFKTEKEKRRIKKEEENTQFTKLLNRIEKLSSQKKIAGYTTVLKYFLDTNEVPQNFFLLEIDKIKTWLNVLVEEVKTLEEN